MHQRGWLIGSELLVLTLLGAVGLAKGALAAVLPGFQGLGRDGDKVALFERDYVWGASYFPLAMTSRGSDLLLASMIAIDRAGARQVLLPTEMSWEDASAERQTRLARGRWYGGVVEASATTDYDGVIDVRLTVRPDRPVSIDGLELSIEVPVTPASVVLGFPADGIRQQKNRKDIVSGSYSGPFLNAVSVSDGDRSLWWFADSASTWPGSAGRPRTILDRRERSIRITHQIVSSQLVIDRPISLRFGLLATPVRELPASVRRDRIVIGGPSAQEAAAGGKFVLWWPTGFAYDAYPYTSYVNNDVGRLKATDVQAYPGLAANRASIATARKKHGIHLLPYFSAHVLSSFDPVVAQNRANWAVDPPKVFRDGLNPYSNAYDKPVLTHNAAGYSQYVVGRIGRLIDELGIEGIYLDHGAVVDSVQPGGGGASLGQSLDIFAVRSFVRALREQFHKRGKAGYVFLHVSNREIIPAYTFATGLVDGEQYRAAVGDGSYLRVIGLDEFRARFAPGQYGVPNYWLPGDWYFNRADVGWRGSPAQLQAYRRVAGLALAHDTPTWPQGAYEPERRRIVALLDHFGIDAATFKGYWTSKGSQDDPLVISQYQTASSVMLVVLNRTEVVRDVSLRREGAKACHELAWKPQLSDGFREERGGFTASIQPYDFALLTVTSMAGDAVDDCLTRVARP